VVDQPGLFKEAKHGHVTHDSAFVLVSEVPGDVRSMVIKFFVGCLNFIFANIKLHIAISWNGQFISLLSAALEKIIPNVMYELGIAHANRMPEEVIIIRDNCSEQAPFDIKHIRWNTYSPTALKTSISVIKRLLRVAQKQVNVTKDLIIKKVISSLEPDAISFLQVIREQLVDGFDLYPFDPDRKGLYSLPHKDCSENYLRLIARNLIVLGVLKAAPLLPPQDRIYGVTPEYYLTNLGKALMAHIPNLPE